MCPCEAAAQLYMKCVIDVAYRGMSKRRTYRIVKVSLLIIAMFHRKGGTRLHGNASVVLEMNWLFYSMLSLSPALSPALVQQESEDVSADD